MPNATNQEGRCISLRSLINHVSSHTNALQALSLNVPIQNLILKHLMLSTLGAVTQKEWELHTAREDSQLTTEFISFFGNKMQGI